VTAHVRRALGALLAIPLVASACAFGGGATPTASGCPSSAPTADQAGQILSDAGSAVVKTNKGEFTIALYGDAAPIATANFVALARCNFYAGIDFHRVAAGFVIQAGDPQTRTNRNDFDALGTGGPGYAFAIEPPADNLRYDKYAVAMANTGQPNSNGSQFFVDLADLNGQLARSYTIFGTVTAGTDVVDAIGAVPTNGARAVPLDPVIIEAITIGSASAVPSAS
jgi:cyclophilin family peptidyl-prolyl cis-trans isomerase